VASALALAMACSSNPAATNKPPAAPSDGGTSNEAGADGGEDQQPANPKANVTAETLDVDGVTRSFMLAMPKEPGEKPLKLTFVLHGDDFDGPTMRRVHAFDVEANDSIVVYPTGTGNAWNLYEPLATNPDMKFIEKLLEHLATKYKVDPIHVFGVGFSAGGYFLNQLACRKNGFLRGIVVYAGGAPDEPNDPAAGIWPSGYVKCKDQLPAPQGGVAVMAVHGDQDSPETGEFVSTYWAGLNGCMDTRSATTPSPCEKSEGCPADKPVVFCKIPGMGHVIWDQGVKEGWTFLNGL